MKEKKEQYNYEALRELSCDLNLSFETQDWGIINADAHRFEEFIQYFEGNKDVERSLRYELFELIIASFNELLLETGSTSERDKLFKQFLNSTRTDETFEPIITYWKGITSEEFPVGKYMRT